MRFDSIEFLLFFVVVLCLHRVVAWRRLLLVASSYLFYASWNAPFLLLLLFSSFLDFEVAKWIEASPSPRVRRVLLICSLAANLGLLVYFKYFNFFLDNILAVTGADAGIVQGFYLKTFIPLGISFYTFQTMSYTVDVYRGEIPACRDRMEFALFIAFFPQLIAGPILRAKDFIPQIQSNQKASRDDLLGGLELCFVGLFKKIVIADNLGIVVDHCYAAPASFSGLSLLIATFAFSAQVFCDFDGYSTMARGLGRMLGYSIPLNFDSPLLASDPIDYRRRWHMTMGTWFRDYLYRPLGGDRHGLTRTLINTFIVWAAFGLWHGASWTFVLWGAYNGLLLAGYRLFLAWGWLPLFGRYSTLVGYLSMPFFVGFANLFVRAESVSQVGDMLWRIFTLAPGSVHLPYGWGLLLLGLYAWHWACRLWYREDLLVRAGWPLRLSLIAGGLSTLFFLAGAGQPFIYFQF